MDATANKPVVTVDPTEIPEGTHTGTWSGYRIVFHAGGKVYGAATSTGIRATAAPCRVTVKAGRITVEATE